MEALIRNLHKTAIPALAAGYAIEALSRKDQSHEGEQTESSTGSSSASTQQHIHILHQLKCSNIITSPSLSTTTATHHCQCESSSSSSSSSSQQQPHAIDPQRRRFAIQRSRTLRVLSNTAKKHTTLSSLYTVDWDQIPIGSGAFGHVLLATHKLSGDRVALKRIPKKLASREDFQREMEALLRIQKWGGHPHICALREHFDEGGYYYLILDLIEGGEMFDHLVTHGAYSEADAARLVREVASALDFMHGIGIVHNDVKPENLMLSTEETRDGVIQLVDFGCAHVEGEDDDDDDHDWDKISPKKDNGTAGFTPAYSAPEAFERRDQPCLPPVDMWALGVIVYIMLTGIHPFDIRGNATDEEIEADVRNVDLPLPLGPDYAFANHLSSSAEDLIRRLMNRDPKERISAYEMLHHPWVTGETASKSIMKGSDKRLNKYRRLKTKLQTQFFTDVVGWADEAIADETRRRTSLIERSFKAFDGSDIEISKLIRETTTNPAAAAVSELTSPTELHPPDDTDVATTAKSMTMSDYSDLLSENMKQRYFPKGHYIYHEGEKGDHMYFLNSGTIEVITSDGIKNTRHAGDFFGEGALLHPRGTRATTIKCKTPVHVIEINREYFEKYMSSSNGLVLNLREKDKIRRRNRAKALLKIQSGMKAEKFKEGDTLYKEGDPGDSMYIVEEGKVDVTTLGHRVIVATPGNFCGEHSLLTGRVRNTTAKCMDPSGCTALRLMGRNLRKLMEVQPQLKESLIDMMNRRDFKKALVMRLGREFPYSHPRDAFDAVDTKHRGELEKEDVAQLMREFDKEYTDNEVELMMQTLDLNRSGRVTFEEFKKVFIGDIRATQSM